MYGLPKDLTLEFLSGQTLLQVCLGVHDLILNFHDDVSITVTSRIACAAPDGPKHEYDDFGQAAPDLMIFLNQTIVGAEGDENGTLRLMFNTGRSLSIYDDSKEYESYTIRHGETFIVV